MNAQNNQKDHPLMSKKKVTPARRQYLDFKAQFPDAVVFFRLGDFYECFDEDAALVSRELELTLTKRRASPDSDEVPMAGVPYHAAEGYIARLVDKGYHVAVIDQIGNEAVNGLVPREVSQVYTPGTVTEASMLQDHQNNYLLALAFDGATESGGFTGAGIAYIDITTGEFAATQVLGDSAPIKVLEEITRLNAREVLMSQDWAERGATLPPGSHLTARPDYQFQSANAAKLLLAHFRLRSLESIGLSEMPLAVSAAGAILEYLKETQRGSISQITHLQSYSTSDFMTLDSATRRTLELTETMRGRTAQGSLIRVLDRTTTPMGARLLRKWIGQPLLDLKRLELRLDAVTALYESGLLRAELQDLLKQVGDLERLTNRLMAGRSGPRELLALAAGLNGIPKLRQALAGIPALESLYDRLDSCDEVVNRVEEMLNTNAPVVLNQVGTIREGVNQELDAVYLESREARHYIGSLEQIERERTGIRTLKVGYNKVFGYYIEISRGLAHHAPQDYIRKQTLVNAERYITPEMKDKETIVMNADERILELERRLFDELLAYLTTFGLRLLKTARAIAHVDVFISFAEVAAKEGYTRPQLSEQDGLTIYAGRHPVVEQSLRGVRFVANDTHFDSQERIHLITGPNMAGKSTYLRQTALIVLMAQIGCYVPADEAMIGMVDRIFTRVGAQDEIHAGQSTFMVEMVETANILNHATERSLVILDEIGRGTSTYDGMAIARAVIEYLHNSPKLNPKTLFATHYHELTELADLLPRVINYNVLVAEEGEEVVFLHRVAPGKADRSYGIHVAQLAGVPKAVVKRATEVLAELEAQGSDFRLKPGALPAQGQVSLFDDRRHPAIEALKALQIDQMSPIDALTKLYELQRLVRQE
jgi:DNA mismatch repair protein MutS